MRKQRPSIERGQSRVEALIRLVLPLAAGALFFCSCTPPKTPPLQPEKVPKAALNRAHDVECANNLRQIRSALQMAQIEGTNPPNLQALGLDQDLLQCPVGGEPYRYDPQTGRVHCIHPGHEGF